MQCIARLYEKKKKVNLKPDIFLSIISRIYFNGLKEVINQRDKVKQLFYIYICTFYTRKHKTLSCLCMCIFNLII